jgi:zinc transport system permease protein
MSDPLDLRAFWEYGFLMRALVAGWLLSLVCGLLSPFVVLRRLSFSSDGLAHASLGGLALGMVLLEQGPAPGPVSYLVTLMFTGGVAALIAYLSGSGRLQSDTVVGVCYVAAFALGVLLLSWRQSYAVPLEHFFFGSILAVNPLECWLLGGLLAGTAIAVVGRWRCLHRWVFDEELAQADHGFGAAAVSGSESGELGLGAARGGGFVPGRPASLSQRRQPGTGRHRLETGVRGRPQPL